MGWGGGNRDLITRSQICECFFLLERGGRGWKGESRGWEGCEGGGGVGATETSSLGVRSVSVSFY